MRIFKSGLGLLVLLSVIVLSGHTSAASTNKYHLHGYDPVSYFHQDGPKKGLSRYTLQYNGFTYLFSSSANLQKFSQRPDKYEPAYDGNCAFGMAYGKESAIDPLVWEIVNDRLFFMINHGTRDRWSKKSSKYIRKGDQYWKKYYAKYQ